MLLAIILLEKLSIATVNCMRQATRSRRRFFASRCTVRPPAARILGGSRRRKCRIRSFISKLAARTRSKLRISTVPFSTGTPPKPDQRDDQRRRGTYGPHQRAGPRTAPLHDFLRGG